MSLPLPFGWRVLQGLPGGFERCRFLPPCNRFPQFFSHYDNLYRVSGGFRGVFQGASATCLGGLSSVVRGVPATCYEFSRRVCAVFHSNILAASFLEYFWEMIVKAFGVPAVKFLEGRSRELEESH